MNILRLKPQGFKAPRIKTTPLGCSFIHCFDGNLQEGSHLLRSHERERFIHDQRLITLSRLAKEIIHNETLTPIWNKLDGLYIGHYVLFVKKKR
jgi:hypothetical protein